jgi:K+-transporting ATPase c subunit
LEPVPVDRSSNQKTLISRTGSHLDAELTVALTHAELHQLRRIANDRKSGLGELVREMLQHFLRYR